MKRKFYVFIAFTFAMVVLTSCSENYSNGERIGLITQFSKSGFLWKSWEGELHVTQTGMNSTMTDFEFSIDNDHEDTAVINEIDSAAQHGWKVKLTYHETLDKNWFDNRGETDHFITGVQVLDRNPIGTAFGMNSDSTHSRTGGVIDTVYVVIVDSSRIKK